MNLSVVLLLLIVASEINLAYAQQDIRAEAGLRFRITNTGKSCGQKCFVISQELTNETNTPIAVRTVALSSTSSFVVPVVVDKSKSLSGRSSTQIGDAWPGDKDDGPCTILNPGQSFKTEVETHLPATFRKGDLVYFDQKYSDFREHHCEKVSFFKGSVKSNQLQLQVR